MKTDRERLLGVKLIAAFFILKTLVFSGAVVVAFLSPAEQAAALGLMRQLAPLLALVGPRMALLLSPAFILLGLTIASGIWFLQGWAWALLLVDCGMPLIRLAEFIFIALIVDHKWLSLIPSSPYYTIDVLSSMIIVAYLLRTDVRRSFGDTTV